MCNLAEYHQLTPRINHLSNHQYYLHYNHQQFLPSNHQVNLDLPHHFNHLESHRCNLHHNPPISHHHNRVGHLRSLRCNHSLFHQAYQLINLLDFRLGSRQCSHHFSQACSLLCHQLFNHRFNLANNLAHIHLYSLASSRLKSRAGNRACNRLGSLLLSLLRYHLNNPLFNLVFTLLNNHQDSLLCDRPQVSLQAVRLLDPQKYQLQLHPRPAPCGAKLIQSLQLHNQPGILSTTKLKKLTLNTKLQKQSTH